MSIGIKAIVLALVVGMAIAAQPALTQPPAPQPDPQSLSDSPAEMLDSDFWIADSQDFRAELLANQISLSEWLEQINQSDLDFLCIGEAHSGIHRQFLADRVIPNLTIDVLMLEADPTQVENILNAVEAGIESVGLLGVDIAGIIRSAQAKNPQIQVIGVDETRQQSAWRNLEQIRSERQRLSRDGFISQNIQTHFQSGTRYVALFGAGHCAAYAINLGYSRPFFRHLIQSVISPEKAKNVRILSSSQANSFKYAMDRAGFSQDTTVISNTQDIKPTAYNFHWDFKSFLDPYDAIIYFSSP
ncbi:MAG: hypothetical protein ACFE0I_14595 [Elainellaceae cyanobacterium]